MFSEILEAASKFNVQDTSPILQREFCALWNHILLKVQNDDDQWMVFRTLGRIRDVYVALHQDTISAPTKLFTSAYNQAIALLEPSLYPLCGVPGHHQDSVPHFHDDSSPTSLARAVPHGHDDTAIVSSFPPSSSPESSTRAPLLDDESPRDVPPLDNNVAVPVSSQPIDRTAIEGCCILATLPNPVAARVTHEGIRTSANTIRPSTPDPSTSTNLPPRSKTSTSPPDVVAYSALRTPPYILRMTQTVPSSPSPTLVSRQHVPYRVATSSHCPRHISPTGHLLPPVWALLLREGVARRLHCIRKRTLLTPLRRFGKTLLYFCTRPHTCTFQRSE
ncbi:hypothetical protein EDB92DRAFT_2103863 [Lactarius akahatsu]|uniref:Uncharacterized protein n=1 Tax=Lactarius akahatsu TaxID=416441 RepID=A0AAD4LGG0_9AGAM|nr:hypothetical protein EDB92DRAFT_2103863 [Lactarius akahatsu]